MYKAIDGEVNGTQLFLVTEGDYKGVTFYFGTVQMHPGKDGWGDGEIDHVTFSFEVTGGPDHLDKDTVEGSEEFQQLVGDILFDFVGKAFEDGKYEMGNLTGNTQQIDVHAK